MQNDPIDLLIHGIMLWKDQTLEFKIVILLVLVTCVHYVRKP